MDRISPHRPARRSRRYFLKRITLLVVFLCPFILASNIASAQNEPSILLVVFKQGKTSVTNAFKKMVKGIEKHSNLRVIEKIVSTSINANEINMLIRKNNAAAVVLLGRKTVALFEDTEIDIPIITGGTLYPVKSRHVLYGLSLTPDPQLLFQRLLNLAPTVKRIHVVYNPERYQWLISFAEAAGAQTGIEIVSYKATDLRSSAKIHREIVQKSVPKEEAIWLLQDSTLVGDANVLPYLLKEAWQRGIVIFSSNPRHVQRGALLSLYSEREQSGEELGTLAKKVIYNRDKLKHLFFPAQKVKSTVNIRSAGHLGIRFNSEQLSHYDLIFPKK